MTKLEGDFESRKKEFIKRYYALVEETGVDFSSVPIYRFNAESKAYELHVTNIPTDMTPAKADELTPAATSNAPAQA